MRSQDVHMLPRESEKLMEETQLELGELQSQLLPPTNTVTVNLLPLACVATVSAVPMSFQVQNISCVSGSPRILHKLKEKHSKYMKQQFSDFRHQAARVVFLRLKNNDNNT